MELPEFHYNFSFSHDRNSTEIPVIPVTASDLLIRQSQRQMMSSIGGTGPILQ